MKKRLVLASLLTIAGALAVGFIPRGEAKIVEAASDSTKPNPGFTTFLPIKNGTLGATDGAESKTLDDLVRWRDTRFWSGGAGFDSQERSYNAMGEFVTTFLPGDGWRGEYRTCLATLADENHRYVSFLLSGINNGEVFVNIWHETHVDGGFTGDYGPGVYNRNVIEGIRPFFDGTGSYDNNKDKPAEEKLNGPVTCNLTFRYYRIPDSVKPGDQFLFFVRDGSTGGYGGIAFGDVHVNQTLEDCARSFSAHKAQMKLNSYISDWTSTANKYVLDNIYNGTYSDGYYAPLIAAEASLVDADDDFEVNDQLSNWAYDMQNSSAMINFSSIYSETDHKDWVEAQPANKSGTMYLNADTSGVSEDQKYRLVSNAFKLNDLGLVSIKLGGKSSKIELLNADTLEVLDGIVNPNFRDVSASDVIGTDTRQNTMTRLFVDWSAYKFTTYGSRVRIAISDYRTGGDWGLAYFDELVTYYDVETIKFKADVIAQGDKHGVILDTYSGSTATDVKAAFDFLNNTYYPTVRNKTANYGYCGSEDLDDVVSAYSLLNDVQQAIVDRSDDFDFFAANETRDANWASHNVIKDHTVGQIVQYIAARFGFAIDIKNAVLLSPSSIALRTENSSNATTIIVIVSAITLLAAASFVCYKKRKHN